MFLGSSNKLVEVHPETFKGLGNLQELDLTDNIQSKNTGKFRLVSKEIAKNSINILLENLFISLV